MKVPPTKQKHGPDSAELKFCLYQ